jgi:hypothetical protein
MNRARKLTAGAAAITFAATLGVTGGFGRFGSTVTQAQTVTTDSVDLSISPQSPVTSTQSFSGFVPGTFHEVLFDVSLAGTDRATLTYTLQGSVLADTTTNTGQPGDATNSIDAVVPYVAVAKPPLYANNSDPFDDTELLPAFATGEGGVVAELYSCPSPKVWDFETHTFVGNQVAVNDYYCDDAANNQRDQSWSNGTLLSGTNSLDVSTTTSNPITLTADLRRGSPQAFLVRYLFVSDGPTGTRQNVQSGEQLQFVNTFKVTPQTGVV